MPPNIFSSRMHTCKILSKSERRYKKMLDFSGFEGIPANGSIAVAICAAQDYILHRECIVGLHYSAFKFIIFFRRRVKTKPASRPYLEFESK